MPPLQWRAVASSANGAKLVAAAGGSSDGLIFSFESTPAPQLDITPSGTNALISWIVPSMSFTLQENSDMTTTNWTDVSTSSVLNLTNLRNQVSVPVPSAGTRFFRLKR